MRKMIAGRRWLLFVLLPLALGMACLCYQRCAQLSAIYSGMVSRLGNEPYNRMFQLFPSSLSHFPYFPDEPRVITRYDAAYDLHDEMSMLFTGQGMTYWTRHRHDKGAYRYHALATSRSYTLNEIQRGKTLEPANGLYDLLEAYVWLNNGICAKEEFGYRDATDRLKDRAKVEKGLTALRALVKKPYVADYTVEIRREQLAKHRVPYITEEYLRDYSITLATCFFSFTKYRTVARKIPACARLLIAEGKPREAEELLELWKPYTRLIMGDEKAPVIQVLAAIDMGRSLTQKNAAIYRQLGNTKKAEELDKAHVALGTVEDTWSGHITAQRPIRPASLGGFGDDVTTEEYKAQEKYLHQYTSYLQQELLDIGTTPNITTYNTAPGRWHEQIVAETLATGWIITIFALLLLFSVCSLGYWWLYTRRRERVELSLPTASEVVRGIVWAILIPYAVYFLLTRLPLDINHRSISSQPVLFYGRLGLMAITVLVSLITRYTISGRKMAQQSNIAMPTTRSKLLISLLTFLLAIALPATCLFAGSLFTVYSIGDYPIVISAILLITVIFISVPIMRIMHRYYSYYQVRTRHLIVGLVTAILAMGVIIMPYHFHQEVTALKNDRLIYGYIADRQQASGGITLRDVDSIRQLRSQVLTVLAGEYPDTVSTEHRSELSQ